MKTVRTRRRELDAGELRRWIGALALVALAVALMARSALAQETDAFDLTGTVIGEAGQPLVGAFVSFSGADWGTLTDEEGRFRIPDVVPGRVVLAAEQLGYADLEWSGHVGPASDGLVLRMEPKAVVLEGLTVVTDRFRRRRNATATSVRAWDRADLATSPYQTAADFVAARAGLGMFSCRAPFSSLCIRSRGRVVAPSVWVDEAPMLGGIDYLQSLAPHELHMVEVYGGGRHIRVYTEQFMERAARVRLQPLAFVR